MALTANREGVHDYFRDLFHGLVFNGEVNSHGCRQGGQHIGLDPMAHSVGKDRYGPVLLLDLPAEKHIPADSFIAIIALFAGDFYVELAAHPFFSPFPRL